MTWWFDLDRAGGEARVWDHTTVDGDPPTLTVPLPDAVLGHLYARGKVDIYALRALGEAVSGVRFEEGTPP